MNRNCKYTTSHPAEYSPLISSTVVVCLLDLCLVSTSLVRPMVVVRALSVCLRRNWEKAQRNVDVESKEIAEVSDKCGEAA